jgi:hypothetical protein
MREPTEEMWEAWYPLPHGTAIEDSWRAMIDAALNEKEAPPVREGL